MSIKQKVLNQHNLTQCTHWVIRAGGEKGTMVGRTSEREYTLGESNEELERFLDNLMPGKYCIEFRPAYKTSGYIYPFTITESNAPQAGSMPVIAGISDADIEDKIDKKSRELFEKFKLETTVETQAKRIAELEAIIAKDNIGQDANSERLWNVIDKVSGVLIDENAPAERKIGNSSNIDDRVQATLEILAEGDPFWLENLEKLATIKKTNKPLYEMAIKYLNS